MSTNDVKSDIFPRKNSFLFIPIHPTLSTFLSFWIILGTIAAIINIANRTLNTIIFSIISDPPLVVIPARGHEGNGTEIDHQRALCNPYNWPIGKMFMPGYHDDDLHDDIDTPGDYPDDEPDFSIDHYNDKSQQIDSRQTGIEYQCAAWWTEKLYTFIFNNQQTQSAN
jgi:hypothetical protein